MNPIGVLVSPLVLTALNGQVFKAKDAKEVIDPAKVQSAADDVIAQVTTSLTGISHELMSIGVDAKTAIKVSGRDYSPVIDELANNIGNLKFDTALDEIVEQAKAKHTELQEKYNEEAKSLVASADAAFRAAQKAAEDAAKAAAETASDIATSAADAANSIVNG